jgi:broad specificity phosphatase PhoE
LSDRRRLIIIRHGRVDFGSREFRETPRGRQWDPPLGKAGREQARLLAAGLLVMERPSAVYTSPFRRCLETVAPFAEASEIDPLDDEDLGEVFVGAWEGESFEQILSDDEEVAKRFREREPLWSLSPGGEDGASLKTRVVNSVERILAAHEQGDVFVVAHGGVINAYVMHVLGLQGQDMFFLPENTSLNIVELDGAARRVKFINDIRHLTDPSVFVRGSASADPGRA